MYNSEQVFLDTIASLLPQETVGQKGIYPRDCNCCVPAKSLKHKQAYDYHIKHSKKAKVRKATLQAATMADSSLPLAMPFGRKAFAVSEASSNKKPKKEDLVTQRIKLSQPQDSFVKELKGNQNKAKGRGQNLEQTLYYDIKERYEAGDFNFLIELKSKIDTLLHEFHENQEEALAVSESSSAEIYPLCTNQELKTQQQTFIEKVRDMRDSEQLEQMLSFSSFLTATITQTIEFRKVDERFLLKVQKAIDKVNKEQVASLSTFGRSTSIGESQEIETDFP